MELGDPSIEGSRRSEPWEGRGAGSRLCQEHESLSSSLGWASPGGVSKAGLGDLGLPSPLVSPSLHPTLLPAGHLQCDVPF